MIKIDGHGKNQDKEINLLIDKKIRVQYNMNKIQRFIWGQCTDALH